MLSWLFGKNGDPNFVQGKSKKNCYCNCKDPGTGIPGAYQLQNYHNLGLNPQASCLPGYLPRDGYGIPATGIDVSSNLESYKLTNMREINQFGQLPLPTIPDLSKGCYNVGAETALFQGRNGFTRKSELPKDVAYYKRSFQVFDSLHYNPENYAVEPFPRIGSDTRYVPKTLNGRK